jgi:hypothetical protein
MPNESDELKMNVEKFFVLLKNYPDDSESTLVFLRFLRTFLRIKSQEDLPTIEVMTLIKVHKPNIFYIMRKLSKRDNVLNFLTGLSMDLEAAEQRLQLLYENKRKGTSS